MALPPTHVIVDFDGTLAALDVGNELCDRFAPASWRDINQEWRRGEVSLPEMQRRVWAMLRASPEELQAAIVEFGGLRPGVDEFLVHAAGRGWPLVLVSGGFDFYIEPLLGRERLDRFTAAYYARGLLTPDRGVELEFRHADLACERLAVCKGKVCERFRSSGPVVFIGDGSSDRCALGKADLVLAVRGKRLASWCAQSTAPWREFDDFHEVVQLLESADLSDGPTSR